MGKLKGKGIWNTKRKDVKAQGARIFYIRQIYTTLLFQISFVEDLPCSTLKYDCIWRFDILKGN